MKPLRMLSRQFLSRLSIVLILTSLSTASLLSAPEYRALTILHTNDTHGHLIPFSYPDPRTPDDVIAEMPMRHNVGGITRRATLFNQIKAETRGNSIMIDAGDALDGTPFSIEYMGDADFDTMRAAGYFLRTNGNHEFSASLKQFNKNIQTGGFPVIDANLLDKSTSKPALPEYIIREINGVNIAFFGLTTPAASSYKAAKEGFTLTDPIETAKKLVPELQKKADIIIAVTHIGYDEDIKLAKEVDGIDIIIGGHSHTRLSKPAFINKTSENGLFDVGGTVIVQAFQWGGELGRLDLIFRRNGGKFTLMDYKGKLIPVSSNLQEDKETKKVLDRYYEPMKKYYDEVVGEAAATFYDDRSGESSVLNLICDALKEKTGADGSIYNTGGVRADIVRGPIKMWDVATVMPFQNNIVIAEMSGARLKQALSELRVGVSKNIRYSIDNNILIKAEINGQPIDDNTIYKIATIDFLADFGLKDVEAKNLNVNYRDAVKEYIKARKQIAPDLDGRRYITNSTEPPV